MNIDAKAAIVTGGASGLGGATAVRLSAAGAKVTIFDVDAGLGEQTARLIGGRCIAVDVTDEDQVAAAIEQAENWHGKARILVNCAGIGPPSKVVGRDGTPLPLAQFAQIINVNLLGSFNVLSQFAARICQVNENAEDRGIIINTASVAAFEGQIGQAAYSASKGGVIAMMLPIAREFARYGIRVMTVAPGLFETPMVASLPQEARASLGKQAPFPNRLGRPDEFAHLAQSIIENEMLNAEVIRLDGAIRMAPK